MPTCCTNPMYKDVKVELDEDIALDPTYDPDYPFGESKATFNEKFWQDVKDLKDSSKGTIDKLTAVRTIRVNRLREACEGDVLIDLIKTKHDNYLHWCRTKGGMAKYDTFVFELGHLAALILAEDFASDNPKYLEQQHEFDDISGIILHLAAARNLTGVMEKVLAKQKSLSTVTTYPDDDLPLYYALQGNHDDAASMLIQHMPNEYVRDLFEDGENDYRFCDIITGDDMKKTVEAILDCLMNPDWPFLPSGDNEEEEGITLPNIPFRYHFYYRLLDGDEEGQPGIKDGKVNPDFNTSKTKSSLQLLAENSTFEDATIRHPVVRMLMRSKWNQFGRFWIRMHLFFYIAFLSVMSVAFLTASSTPDRREYITTLDNFRLFCEVVTLAFTLIFISSEIDEVRKDKMAYLYDPFNYFDILGLVLILLVIPLRFTGCTSADFGVSSAAYLINFLRIGKTATAFKSMSIYLKTFGCIISQEISKFIVIFAIFMLSFLGAVYLALKASKSELLNNNGYWYFFLQEVRSVAEANGLGETDQYTAMHVAVLILVMCNMFCCIVVLNNILIGQIGNSFSQAQQEATIQYDIDRTKMVTRIEAKGFGKWSMRATHYVDKEFLTNDILENDLLEDWIMLKEKKQDKGERKEYIKAMMTNKVSTKQ